MLHIHFKEAKNFLRPRNVLYSLRSDNDNTPRKPVRFDPVAIDREAKRVVRQQADAHYAARKHRLPKSAIDTMVVQATIALTAQYFGFGNIHRDTAHELMRPVADRLYPHLVH